ncbi:MAG: hypothetical protein K2N56_06645 [Oscillospiraceae bacterium]|nr:hypothetical protein [Oscillospiraceae bacterium]
MRNKNNRFIKNISALCAAFLVTISLTLAAFADSAGFAVEKERTYSVKAPYDKNHVEIRWNTDDGENVGAPVVDGEFVLLPALNTVRKLGEKDGKRSGVAMLDEKVSPDLHGAVLNGVLVQPTRTMLYAVETDGMNVLGSRQFGEIVTDVALLDDFAYFGAKTDGGFTFFCADYKNGFKTIWEYACKSSVTSPALYGDMIVFGADDDLVVHRSKDNEYKVNPIGAELTNVFAGRYAVFMTTSDGNVYKIRLETDGSAEEDTLESCMVGGELTAPAEYNNRVYVGSSDGFFILDGLNMKVLKAFPELKNSSAPLITYSTGQRAYTVARDDQLNRDVLYSILDTDDGQTVSEIVKIIDYTGGKCAVSASGTMYFRTADGKLWAITETQNNMFIMILKVVLTLAVIAMFIIIILAWSKKKKSKRPPEY